MPIPVPPSGFTRCRGPFTEPSLTLNKSPIKVVHETRFLGLILDEKLTFQAHIKDLKCRCQKALDVLRVVSHTDWGAEKFTLLRLYRALVRSKLDYGSIVYG